MLNEDYKDMLQALSDENVSFLLVSAYAMAAFLIKHMQVLGEDPERQNRIFVQMVHRRQTNGQRGFVFAKMPIDQRVRPKDLHMIHMEEHDALFLCGELEVLRPYAENHLPTAMAWKPSLRERQAGNP